MTFSIVRNDIVNMDVDVIVNITSSVPSIGDGIDGAINKASGDLLFKERQLFGNIEVGKSIVTSGYNLKASYVIHTVSPLWSGDRQNDFRQLKSCYLSILKNTQSLSINSIAIPLIGTGLYGFQYDEALRIATQILTQFLQDYDLSIYLVVNDSRSFIEVSKEYQYIAEYIDSHFVDRNIIRSSRKKIDDVIIFESMHAPVFESPSNEPLEEYLKSLDEGFSKTLLKLIDISGHDDTYIYKKANIDRKLFSKIRINEDYKPSKATALAFAIALELNLEQTLDLLGRAGYTMSSSSRFDLIVQYHIQNSIYDIYSINEALFAFDQPLLG